MVRPRPAIEGTNSNDVLMRDRAGEPVGFDQADVSDDPDALSPANGMLSPPLRMQVVFQGTLGKHRYTRPLAGTDLAKVIFACGTMDGAVGRLTGEEVVFLESRGADVLAAEGGHGSMFHQPASARVVELLGDRGEVAALTRFARRLRKRRSRESHELPVGEP